MAVKYSGVTCELREVSLKAKPNEMLAASSKGTVPVLVLNNRVIDESVDVMRWALQTCDPEHWGSDELGHPLVERNDNYFKTYLDRYKYFDRYPEQSQHVYLEKALLFLDELEALMVPSSSGVYHLVSAGLSTLDVAIFPFIRQFAFVDKAAFDALSYPKIQSWLASLLAGELFMSVMVKHQTWSSNQEQTVYI